MKKSSITAFGQRLIDCCLNCNQYHYQSYLSWTAFIRLVHTPSLNSCHQKADAFAHYQHPGSQKLPTGVIVSHDTVAKSIDDNDVDPESGNLDTV